MAIYVRTSNWLPIDRDEALAASLENALTEQVMVNQLVAKRCQRNLTQADVAKKMGCTQSRISKLEATGDAEWTLAEIADYARAIGLNARVTFQETRQAG